MIDPSALVHPLARVDETAHVGPRSRVWQFATLIRGARLGADCSMAAGACLDGSRAGDRTVICHNLAAGPGFSIGNDCFIGPNVTLCNDNWPRAHKRGFHPEQFDDSNWAIIIEDGASIGAGAVIMPGVVVGAGAMVAAGARVTRDVPPGHIWKDARNVRLIVTEPPRMRFAKRRAPGR